MYEICCHVPLVLVLSCFLWKLIKTGFMVVSYTTYLRKMSLQFIMPWSHSQKWIQQGRRSVLFYIYNSFWVYFWPKKLKTAIKTAQFFQITLCGPPRKLQVWDLKNVFLLNLPLSLTNRDCKRSTAWSEQEKHQLKNGGSFWKMEMNLQQSAYAQKTIAPSIGNFKMWLMTEAISAQARSFHYPSFSISKIMIYI